MFRKMQLPCPVANQIVMQRGKGCAGVPLREFVRTEFVVTLVRTAAMAILAAEFTLLPHP